MSVGTASRILTTFSLLKLPLGMDEKNDNLTDQSGSEVCGVNGASSVTYGSMARVAEDRGENSQHILNNTNAGGSPRDSFTRGQMSNSPETEDSLSSVETVSLTSSEVIKAGTKLENEYLYELKNFLKMLFTLGFGESLVEKRAARRVDESIEICFSLADKLPENLDHIDESGLVLYRNVRKKYALVLDSEGNVFAYSLGKDLNPEQKATEEPMLSLKDGYGLARFKKNVLQVKAGFLNSNLSVLLNYSGLISSKKFLFGKLCTEEFLNQIDLAVLKHIKFIFCDFDKISGISPNQSFTLDVDHAVRVGQLVCINNPQDGKGNARYIDGNTRYAQKIIEGPDGGNDTYKLVTLKQKDFIPTLDIQNNGRYHELFLEVDLKLLASKFTIFEDLKDIEHFEYAGDLLQITKNNCNFGDIEGGDSNILSCRISDSNNPGNYIKVSCRGSGAVQIVNQIKNYLRKNQGKTLKDFLDQTIYVEDYSNLNNALSHIKVLTNSDNEYRLAILENMFPSINQELFRKNLSAYIELLSPESRQELAGDILAKAREVFIQRYRNLTGITLRFSDLRKLT